MSMNYKRLKRLKMEGKYNINKLMTMKRRNLTRMKKSRPFLGNLRMKTMKAWFLYMMMFYVTCSTRQASPTAGYSSTVSQP